MKKALVCLVMLAAVLYTAPAFAQTSGWLDVNVGAAVPAEGARNTTYNWTDYGWGGEQATLAVDYKQLTGANIDGGAAGCGFERGRHTVASLPSPHQQVDHHRHPAP